MVYTYSMASKHKYNVKLLKQNWKYEIKKWL